MQDRQAKSLPTFQSRVVISLASATALRSGSSEHEEAAAQGADKDAFQTIEEQVKAEIKAGKQPVALPTEQIANFFSKLFPLPYSDDSTGKDGQRHANNGCLTIVSNMLLTR